MYLPEGNVMPAYSTWQPTEGKIQPVASADQSATRRLVDPRGDLLRGKPIVSTLLGVFGGPSDRFLEGGNTAVGSPFLVPAARACWPSPHDWNIPGQITRGFPPHSGREQSTIGRGRRVIYSSMESAGSTVLDQ